MNACFNRNKGIFYLRNIYFIFLIKLRMKRVGGYRVLIRAQGIEGGGGAFGAIILIYPARETDRL